MMQNKEIYLSIKTALGYFFLTSRRLDLSGSGKNNLYRFQTFMSKNGEMSIEGFLFLMILLTRGVLGFLL